jgi:hypothetical protein
MILRMINARSSMLMEMIPRETFASVVVLAKLQAWLFSHKRFPQRASLLPSRVGDLEDGGNPRILQIQ